MSKPKILYIAQEVAPYLPDTEMSVLNKNLSQSIISHGYEVRTFMPKYAIISCGKNNMYGHPHRETMDLLNNKELDAEVYRTDEQGDILVKSNGKEIYIETSK